ncbi:hypothetical protein FC690_07670, partial [Bacillus cereus]
QRFFKYIYHNSEYINDFVRNIDLPTKSDIIKRGGYSPPLLFTYAFLTNCDFNFIAPKPSILQSIS